MYGSGSSKPAWSISLRLGKTLFISAYKSSKLVILSILSSDNKFNSYFVGKPISSDSYIPVPE